MSIRWQLYISALCLLVVSLQGVIYEHNSLSSVSQYIDHAHIDSTLVIFDLDNTITTPITDFGSDQWFYYQWNKKQAEGYTPQDALCYLLPLYYQIHGNIQLTLTEPDASDLITNLQNQGIAVIGLTARGFPIVKRTINQLHQLGVSFSKTAFFDNCLKEPTHQCAQGIIFCAGNKKDAALFEVIESSNYRPSHIIFVDDKRKYLEMLEYACQVHNISFIGIRYGGCDARVASFDMAKADQEFAEFDTQCTVKLYS